MPGSGTDKPQPCQHTSSIHAGSPSIIHTLQQAHAFQTHYQSRDYVLKRDAAATAIEHPSAPGVYIHKQAPLASHFSTTVSSLLLWPLLPSCLCTSTRHGTFFGSQLPDMLLPVATSDLAGEVSLDRYEHLFFHHIFFLSLCFAHLFRLQFLTDSTLWGAKAKWSTIAAPSFDHYHLLHTIVTT